MDLLSPWRKIKAPTRSAWAKRATIALPLLCLLVFGTMIGTSLLNAGNRASAANLLPIKGHVPALVKTSTLVGPTDTNKSISLAVGLRLRNEANLKTYVDNLSRADSLTKQHLTSAQIAAAYAPLASSQQSVIDYLQGYGFHVTKTLSQHLLIDVQGTVSDAENAFHIQINNYHSPKGQDFYAPSSDPAMPANLAGLVLSIAGLDNVAHFTYTPIKQAPLQQPSGSTAHVSANGVPCLGQGSGHYLPSQLAAAYNLNGFYNAGFHGEGQNVALIEFDDYIASDISTYTSCYGGGQVPINKILVDGGAGAPNGGNVIEVELDMDLILSAAPNLASLNVYEAPNTFAQGNDMWAQIINDNRASVISTSWGACENAVYYTDPKNPGAILQQENSLFTIAAAQGQTIVAAAGDHGTNDCQFDLGHPDPQNPAFKAVDDPASQPYVTGVGGTTLTLSGSNYGSETAWNDGLTTYSDGSATVWAGGGGISQIWPMPSWQQGPGVNNSYTSGSPCGAPSGTNCREVPDVSLHAGSGNGYPIYCSIPVDPNTGGCGNPAWIGIGGTSAAAPMWAAFIALTNQKSLHDGGFNVGFINPYLYQIDQNLNGTSYANDFHDVTQQGNNDGLNDGTNTYPTTSGYDMATGLGSYNAWNLGNDLEKLSNAQNGSRGAPASTTWYFAEGSVGNSFTEFLTLLNPNTKDADITITYLFAGKKALPVNHVVPANSRFTVRANDDVGVQPTDPQQAISAIVTSTNNVPIVAERPMYFNLFGIASGTDALGATSATNTTFYFANGDSTQNSNDHAYEFITILNPSSTATAHITATYYTNGQIAGTSTVDVPPLQRGTTAPGFSAKAAVQVTSNIGVVVERPMYVNENIPNAGGMTTGASSAVGATSLGGPSGSDWLFAEGYTGPGFQEDLVLANFTQQATTATIKLEYANGTVQTVAVPVSGWSQIFFDVNNAFANPNCTSANPCTPTTTVSAEVTAPTASIVAERVMFFHYSGNVSGETDAVGQAGPASQSTYSFAEGYTGSGFSEYLTLQNPTSSSEVVAITYFADNTIVQQELTLPAHSRSTVSVNSVVVPIATAYPNGAAAYTVSMTVQALHGGVVVAERPLYFVFAGDPGGTDVIGYTGN